MREIRNIVLHCSGTSQDTTVEEIQKYWRETLKWRFPGYHYIIEADGKVTQLSDIARVTNGVARNNADAIHICYIGGVDARNRPLDNRTPKQILKTLEILIELLEKFPKANILGHRDFPNVAKACPSFDVASWLTSVGLRR